MKYRSDEYFEKRRKVASASDFPSLIGLGYRHAWDVLQDASVTETEAMRHGTHYEPQALQALRDLVFWGIEVIEDPPMYMRDKYGCTPDGLVYFEHNNTFCGLEVKCPYYAKGHFNSVPRVIHVIQCFVNMFVLGTKYHFLAMYAPAGHRGREQPELIVWEIQFSVRSWELMKKMLWHAREMNKAGCKIRRRVSGKREWDDLRISSTIFYRVHYHRLSNGRVVVPQPGEFRVLPPLCDESSSAN